MGRPRSGTHKVPTTERILEAAEQAFGTLGYTATRLEDIARQAGIRRPSLLYHFSTKQVLYGAVVHRLFSSLMQTLTAAIEHRSAYEERVMALMDSLLAFLEERPAFAPIVLREIIDGNGPGRTLLLHGVVPVLDQVEAWLRSAASPQAPSGFDFRGAIVQTTVNALVRASSGPLRTPIWGTHDERTLVTRLFFIEPH